MVSDSLSIFRATICSNVWLVIDILCITINGLISLYCNVMKYSTCTYHYASLFRFHPYFRVKHMKPAFPPAKGLLNGHPGSCMGLVVCFLFRCCWVEVGVIRYGLQGYPLSPRSKPFSSEKD